MRSSKLLVPPDSIVGLTLKRRTNALTELFGIIGARKLYRSTNNSALLQEKFIKKLTTYGADSDEKETNDKVDDLIYALELYFTELVQRTNVDQFTLTANINPAIGIIILLGKLSSNQKADDPIFKTLNGAFLSNWLDYSFEQSKQYAASLPCEREPQRRAYNKIRDFDFGLELAKVNN